MNKLEGFQALRKSGLPTVPWKKYKNNVVLNNNILWTIRSAVAQGDDLNLPRRVGVTAQDAKEFADTLLTSLSENDLVIYYPFFIAIKSGVIEVSGNRIVIEGVKDDLWNLVTNNNKDVTIIFENENIEFIGDSNFFNQQELLELIDYCNLVKKIFSQILNSGKSLFLEWSFACKSSLNKEIIGDTSLIFYEIRTV